MPNYTVSQIHNKLKDVYIELSKEYNVFYIALYGSQNYNLHTENSDLDFKAIIIPTLEDLVNQSKPTSKVYTYDWGQVEVKDIRNYIESAVKVNVNFIELLNTMYWFSPYEESKEFREFFCPLLKEQGQIYLRACMGMIMQKFHALRHPYPSKLNVIEKFSYDPKQLCHIVRLTWLMNRYIHGNYSFYHDGLEKEDLIALKEGIITEKELDEYALKYLDIANSYVENYHIVPTFETKYKMIQFSRDLIIKFIKQGLKN